MERIVLVVLEDFGERVVELAHGAYVWLVGAPANDLWAREVWKRQDDTNDAGLTTFSRFPNEDTDSLVCRVLETIDDHHGEFARERPWSRIEVVGCPPSPSIRETAANIGGDALDVTADGFCVSRRMQRR